MGFYDFFAGFYDSSLETLYAEHRQLATAALSLAPDSVVLDVPCGTGQSFEGLRRGLGPQGLVFGADTSEGMLKRAHARIEARGWSNVHLVRSSAAELQLSQLRAAVRRDVAIDRLHVFLGMSVFSDPERTFEHLWSLLAPGGRCVIVDVYSERLSVQGWLVNQIARADIRRRFWEPLERVAKGFERHDLPYKKQHGGQIMLATGTKE